MSSVIRFNLNFIHTGSVSNSNSDLIEAEVAVLSLDHEIESEQLHTFHYYSTFIKIQMAHLY
jgi:hypothetical protein